MVKNVLFALFGIGIIISFVLLFVGERNREWKKYQRAFKKMDMEMVKGEVKNATNEKERRRLQQALDGLAKASVEVKQVYLKDLEVTDRCHTCHLGTNDPRWAHAPQPFTSHTEPILSSHPVASFGCTPCHQGQGPATTTRGGHGFEANWKDPLLPLNYIEASCSQCHTDLTFREAPLLSRGKYLIGRLGCLGCHEGRGFKAEEKIGPVLDTIGLKADPDWITRFLKDPGEYSKETRMPNFQFTDDEIQHIREFLLTSSERDEK